jgi:hypothetical protein
MMNLHLIFNKELKDGVEQIDVCSQHSMGGFQ